MRRYQLALLIAMLVVNSPPVMMPWAARGMRPVVPNVVFSSSAHGAPAAALMDLGRWK